MDLFYLSVQVKRNGLKKLSRSVEIAFQASF